MFYIYGFVIHKACCASHYLMRGIECQPHCPLEVQREWYGKDEALEKYESEMNFALCTFFSASVSFFILLLFCKVSRLIYTWSQQFPGSLKHKVPKLYESDCVMGGIVPSDKLGDKDTLSADLASEESACCV